MKWRALLRYGNAEKMGWVMGVNKDTGGSAFPFARFDQGGKVDWANIHEGMTLRDYFAGQALISAMQNHNAWATSRDIAQNAYHIADAMIEARNNA